MSLSNLHGLDLTAKARHINPVKTSDLGRRTLKRRIIKNAVSEYYDESSTDANYHVSQVKPSF